MTKIAILGSGTVGEVLAGGFLAQGNAVMRASREPQKLADWKAKTKGETAVGTFAEAASWGDLVVLAVKGSAAEGIVEANAGALAGKVVIDTTNPIGDAPPVNGVIQYFTKQNESLMQRLQAKAPAAKFVKAFNSVGNAFMVNPKGFAQTPTMFFCGNDAAAKQEVAKILAQFGHDPVDMGGVEAAGPIESLCILWCIPGLIRKDWAHSFKLQKLG